MDTETMVEELQELIADLARERVRAGEEDGDGLEIRLDLDPDGQVIATAAPAPPATEAEIAQAEAALGRPYPPELRALLGVANGFPGYFYGDTLLGTSGVGTAGVAGYPAQFPASIWGIAREYIDEWYAAEVGRLEFSPEDPLDCIPLASDPDASGAAFVVAGSGPGWDAGTVVELEGGVHRYENVREYLRARLALVREA
ncbi:Knr4/Smi1-like domain-containing protein OS=Tsukamurella paurometabola (strain ATCC 8368 / DSM/ CCUG 35730 / CIP 100753 / JCM 10117 / KCTC 9821 / NBRC 16120 / NCIMB 702349 / NCTC 13040) OX=521096 GN=Tpau_0625 PE=4 SV=1 [Tsukamurella paurometabola]|uniref:Knr4/Smi1-like domain-containing protein n=1 Tax=Tsukamurella paurometabola (strain ATCC 8368 / DSM 20162 / CCUG 35730 / CIP 100753 / JCM 10117 / KCTC 9821 / NBRC 16120 / NCIMB 702349 / NCTC 13040) TaxID=521096 RepID=D5USX6_TSUPD|nr:SMI1/KNR4 family protein [Tsukamurella paurometabola]ADG77263.1 hypothetical protein Tpau_0625 [Tsukamurella paurometabola DSM 20162]SUP43320.1 Uncharacterised protein [Tsukamurella paurometabola]